MEKKQTPKNPHHIKVTLLMSDRPTPPSSYVPEEEFINQIMGRSSSFLNHHHPIPHSRALQENRAPKETMFEYPNNKHHFLKLTTIF